MGLNEIKSRWAAQRSERTPCSEEHDQICRYVKQTDILTQIAQAVLGVHTPKVSDASTEFRIEENCGRFARFVGFADVFFVADEYEICVEVNSGKIIVGEVLRQLKNYQAARNTWRNAVWCHMVLVAAHLEPEQVEHLRSEGVTPIVLGTKYLEWKAPKGAPALEI